MRAFLAMRLAGPLMSFGDVLVDQRGGTAPLPGKSLITGLLGNAFGWEHRDVARLQALQNALVIASRCDVEGRSVTDYQTVDLGQDFMQAGWTTLGQSEGRAGGSASKGTHIRERTYWADRIVTLVATWNEDEVGYSIQSGAQALQSPERPLFLGRKSCLPTRPLFHSIVEATDVFDALCAVPPDPRAPSNTLFAWWPAGVGPADGKTRVLHVFDERNWANQVHTGRRAIHEGRIEARPEAPA